MKLNKPYVWVNHADDSDNLELQILIRCDDRKDIYYFQETVDDERLIVEFHIRSGTTSDPVIHPLYGAGSYYNPSIHRKVTVKIMEGDVLKGLCTVMPVSTYFS